MPLLRLEFGDACQAIPDDSTRIATYVGGLGAARTNLQIVQRHHDVELTRPLILLQQVEKQERFRQTTGLFPVLVAVATSSDQLRVQRVANDG